MSVKNPVPPSFKDALKKAFKTVPAITKLELRENRDDVFEIPSTFLSLSIRWQVAHSGGRGILVTLFPASKLPVTTHAKSGEIGLTNVVEFYGDSALAKMVVSKTNGMNESEPEIHEALGLCALAVEKYCLPLLTGPSDDWPKIEQFVKQKIEASRLERKNKRFR